MIWVPFLHYAQNRIKYPNVIKAGILTEKNAGLYLEYYKDFRSFDIGAGFYYIKHEAEYAPMRKNLFSSGYSYPVNKLQNFSILLGKRFFLVDNTNLHFQLGGTYNNYHEVSSWEKKDWLFSSYYNYNYRDVSYFGIASRLSLEIAFSKNIGISLGGYYDYNYHKQHYGLILNFIFGNLHL